MSYLTSFSQDSRFARRVLSRTLGMTVLAVISIMLGIGLITATFSVADAVLLRPLPVPRPDQLLQVVSRAGDGQPLMYGWLDCEDISAAGSSLETACYEKRGAMLSMADRSELVSLYAVTTNFFSLLGVKPIYGQASFGRDGGRGVTVLGYRFWQQRFDRDPAAIGKTIVLNQKPFTVIGVLPREFMGLDRGVVNDLWISTASWFDVLANRDEMSSRDGQFEIIGRLKNRVEARTVVSEVDAAIRGPRKHRAAPPGVVGTELNAAFVPTWKTSLLDGGGLLALLGLLLFVACANVAQLRLAQAESRKAELGMRLALGASGSRLMQEVLLEVGMLTVAGSVLGICIAHFLIQIASDFLSQENAFTDYGIRLDQRALTFTVIATLVATLVAGLGPARQVLMLNVLQVVKSDERVMRGRGAKQRILLVVGQVAASVALFGMTVLFLESFRNASAIRPGFEPHRKMVVLSVVPGFRWPAIKWCEQASDRLSALVGVRGVTFARWLPLSSSGGDMTVQVEVPGQALVSVGVNNIAGNYFRVMGTRILEGRAINGNDRLGAPAVIVVSRQFVRQLLHGRIMLGQMLRVEGQMRQIVGVSEDVSVNSVHDPPHPFLYVPFAQMPSDDIRLIIETSVDPKRMTRAIQHELKRYDPGALVYSSTTLREYMQQALSPDRMLATLSVILGGFTCTLTAVGIFGVNLYSVNRRRREIGLRMAVGARPSDIGQLLAKDSLRIAAMGIPIGLVLLWAAAWWTRSIVLEVTPLDPLTYVVSTVAVLLLVFLAACLPVAKAASVDPVVALRSE